jgi:hypothetical protein
VKTERLLQNNRRKWIQEEQGIVVSSAVEVKAAKRTAHKRMAKEIFSAVVRRRTVLVLVDILIHHRKIKMDSHQSI